MTMRRGAAAVTLALLMIGPTAALAQSQPVLDDLQWLDADAAVSALSSLPRRHLKIESEGGRASVLVTLGELAFRSPRILGGEARRLGISCQTCHPNGGANAAFSLPGVSDRPGNVDVTHRLFNTAADDGLSNQINIPSLRGIARTAPYGHDGRSASLRDFVRAVIVTEFSGAEPPGWLMDALEAYLRQLAFLPAPELGADGRVVPSAGAAALRGEAIFRRGFPGRPEMSCAVCHRPGTAFVDGLSHDIGSGGTFDTPTLLNLADSAPYFHDGRYTSLAEVLVHFDRVYGLQLTTDEERDLVVYLETVGAVRQAREPAGLSDDLEAVQRFFGVVRWAAGKEDAAVGGFAAQSLRRELGRIYQRLPQESGGELRHALRELSSALNRLAVMFERGAFVAARAGLPQLERTLARAWGERRRAAEGSLYDETVLQRSLAPGGRR